jgi:hypothetical protein
MPRSRRRHALFFLGYIRGKWGTSLAQMLDRRSPFPQALPINGLC